MLSREETERLIDAAIEARDGAYAPYSHYFVGAALLTKDGKICTGANVENASYGVSLCAERNAMFHAVADGIRGFAGIAITAAAEGVDLRGLSREEAEHQGLDYPTPCGACRQGLREFVEPSDFQVILARTKDDYKVLTLEDLLPMSFGPGHLEKG